MGWNGKNTLMHFISVAAIIAMLAGFSQAELESLHDTFSSSERSDELSEAVYSFPDKIVEAALFTRADDSDFSFLRIANQRFFAFSGTTGLGSASCFSQFQFRSKENYLDNKNTILVKLRI